MSEWGSMLKPETFAPLLIGIGAFMLLFCKKERQKEIAQILVGFGVLFVGLSYMSGSIAPYKSAPIFSTAFSVLGNNPILGILTGAVVTGIIQSSSASVGILQTLAKMCIRDRLSSGGVCGRCATGFAEGQCLSDGRADTCEYRHFTFL